MAGHEAMQEVELGEEPGPGPGAAEAGDPDAEGRRRRRRALLRWWPVAAVAVAGVVGVQVLQDVRERGRVAAAREVDGVVRYDVGPELPTSPVDSSVRGPFGTGTIVAGDLRVAAEEVDFGKPRAVSAVDAVTGAEAWRTAVETQEEATARPTMREPQCWAAGETGGTTRVRCLVSDRPATLTGDGGWTEDPPTRSRVLTFDAGTGAVLTDREVAAQTSVAADDAVLVLGEVVADGTVRVTAEDVATQEDLWTTELAGVTPDPVFDPHVTLLDDHVLLWAGQRSHVLARSDGAVQADGVQVWVGRGGGLLVQDDDPGSVRLAGPDGTGTAVVPALPVQLDVDDGSVPGVEILSAVVAGDRTLRAVDAVSGTTLWEARLDGRADGAWLLLDGVLYGVDATAVRAVDAWDGREVWRTYRELDQDGQPVRDTSGSWAAPATDGRALLLVEQDEEGGSLLAAWSLRSGALLWRTPLPPETNGWASAWGGALYGGLEELVRIGG
ncbi:outer membrane protein assembly factor BamB family protein [Cellulomonas pakistanensis]|uniref:Pyrrolo-quinoline quinone repeat domain-containing protein n=1 Tax=Cellulomonas pakistanensis TaxID=992287 RepID=A0A919P659_9CELL|nr:PQQ-binding-like beta-propeller repeat protein [Cellulomonas pakistanensis]GIG35054.1 hypothetical protein Cpa01nite_04350 [Cellulomonas pakistanensis]